MGYRSDVGYVIAFENVEELKKFVAINMLISGRREALQECGVFIGQTDDRPMLFYHAEDIKWYSSFPEVQAHTELLNFVDEQFCDGGIIAGYKFIRIGEDAEDIVQTDGGDHSLIPWDALHVSRSLVWEIAASARGDGTIDIVSKL